jgi:hypothetical protein
MIVQKIVGERGSVSSNPLCEAGDRLAMGKTETETRAKAKTSNAQIQGERPCFAN